MSLCWAITLSRAETKGPEMITKTSWNDPRDDLFSTVYCLICPADVRTSTLPLYSDTLVDTSAWHVTCCALASMFTTGVQITLTGGCCEDDEWH